MNQNPVALQRPHSGSAEAVEQPTNGKAEILAAAYGLSANGKTQNPVLDVPVAQSDVSENVKQYVAQTSPVRHSVPKNPAPEPTKRISASKYAEANKQRTKERGSANATRSTQTSIPVQSPNKLWWVRTHRDPSMMVRGISILKLEGDTDETYFLAPDVEFPDELDRFIVPANLTLSITAEGTLFFWLAKQTKKSPKDSVRRCQEVAKEKWIQVRWDAQAKGYSFEPARQLHREPVWPNESLDDLLDKAIGDKYIDRANHEIINKLLYPDDEDFGGE
jgi:hypothetical protein